VALPRTPFPGLIVRYAFLWSDEAQGSDAAQPGRTEARKDRPCVIVVAVRRETGQHLRVRVVPITHAPHHPDRAVQVPPKVKRHLGLDADASWIVLDEANEFVWPGVDLRPISRTKPGVWTYGVLPRELFEALQTQLRRIIDQRRITRTD
jgi:hypothetical protein